MVILMLYHVFYMITKFYGFTCTLLDSGMPIRILVCLKRLYRIYWQAAQHSGRTDKKFARFLGLAVITGFARSLDLARGSCQTLAKRWHLWWDPSEMSQGCSLGPSASAGPMNRTTGTVLPHLYNTGEVFKITGDNLLRTIILQIHTYSLCPSRNSHTTIRNFPDK